MDHNERKFQRAPLGIEVGYRTTGSFLISYSTNLSRGGLFLESDNPPSVGTILTIRFRVPGQGDSIETTAKVVWSRDTVGEDGQAPGFGLQFDNLESHIGEVIDRLVVSFAGVKLLAVANTLQSLERMARYLESVLNCRVLKTQATEIDEDTSFDGIDLAVIDLDSTAAEGLRILSQLKSGRAPVPTIVLSRDAATRDIALREGADVVLHNPPLHAQLRQRALEMLGKPYKTR